MPDAKAAAVVKAENKDRMDVYKKRAKQNKPPMKLSDFMKIMGAERIKKEKPGRYVEAANGKWIKKK